jgi:hypothetical protein
VWSFQGGVNMFDSTFLLGPLHFLQEERISIQIFGKGQKRHFSRHLYIKRIILPRQARDKHRENSKKSGVSHSCHRALRAAIDMATA